MNGKRLELRPCSQLWIHCEIYEMTQWWYLSQSILVWATVTKYYSWVAYKQQKFISHSSGGWKSKIGVLVWLAWWGLSSGLQSANFSLDLHMAERVIELSGISYPLIRTLIPFTRAPSWYNYLLKSHPLIPSHWGLGFQHTNLGRTHVIHCTGLQKDNNMSENSTWNDSILHDHPVQGNLPQSPRAILEFFDKFNKSIWHWYLSQAGSVSQGWHLNSLPPTRILSHRLGI